MERALYDSLRAAERSWWYRGRTAAARSFLRTADIPAGPALDFGAAYGAMFEVLSPGRSVDAVELFPECLPALRERGYRAAVSDLTELPHEPYSLIGAFDVIEHVIEDAELIRAFRARLLPRGVLIATVPAHQFLWSQHDADNHHVRRYAYEQFRRLLENNGFTIERLSYWNASLFPVACLMRLLGRGGKEGLAPAAPINAVLTWIVWVEAVLLRYFPLPMGLSLIVLARAKE